MPTLRAQLLTGVDLELTLSKVSRWRSVRLLIFLQPLALDGYLDFVLFSAGYATLIVTFTLFLNYAVIGFAKLFPPYA